MHGTGSTYRARRLVFFLIASVAGCGAAGAAATKEECDGLKAEQAALQPFQPGLFDHLID